MARTSKRHHKEHAPIKFKKSSQIPLIKSEKTKIITTEGAKTEGMTRYSLTGSIKGVRSLKETFGDKPKVQTVVKFKYRGEEIIGYSKLKNLGNRTTDESMLRSARGNAIKRWNREHKEGDRPISIEYSEANKLRIDGWSYNVFSK